MINNYKIIEAKNLSINYGSKKIQDNISFDVHSKTICTIIGGSGSGKTTLLRALLGLIKHQSGSIKILGKDIDSLTNYEEIQLRRKTSVLFQDGALFSGLNVRDNITFPLNELIEVDIETKKLVSAFWLKQVGLTADVGEKMPSELSGGMRKRVGLARALILEPSLIFLDEPTSGLDPISSRQFDSLILSLRDTLNTTFVMISHDLDSIINISDQIIALGNQKIIANGTLSEVLSSNNEWIKNYFKGKTLRA